MSSPPEFSGNHIFEDNLTVHPGYLDREDFLADSDLRQMTLRNPGIAAIVQGKNLIFFSN